MRFLSKIFSHSCRKKKNVYGEKNFFSFLFVSTFFFPPSYSSSLTCMPFGNILICRKSFIVSLERKKKIASQEKCSVHFKRQKRKLRSRNNNFFIIKFTTSSVEEYSTQCTKGKLYNSSSLFYIFISLYLLTLW